MPTPISTDPLAIPTPTVTPTAPPVMTDAFKTAMANLRTQYEQPPADESAQQSNGRLTPQMVQQVQAMANEPWLRQQQWAMYGQPNANIGSNMAGMAPPEYIPMGLNTFGAPELVPGWAETGTPWEQTLKFMEGQKKK